MFVVSQREISQTKSIFSHITEDTARLMHDVEVIGAARLYRAASVWTARLGVIQIQRPLHVSDLSDLR
jgi:hypothetical protein